MTDENTSSMQGVSSQGDETNSKKLTVWIPLKISPEKRNEALSLFAEKGVNPSYTFQAGEDYENNKFHFMIGGNAFDFIKSLTAGTEEDAELAMITPYRLDLHNRPTYKEVISRISSLKKIGFCRSAEELIFSRTSFLHQKKGSRVIIPFQSEDKKTCFRLQTHENSTKGHTELWLLQGSTDPNRICDAHEVFIVRLIKRTEREFPKTVSLLSQVILSLEQQDWSKKQNPTL